jgi:acetyl/propionyl-CoA carboxylase alpha subunit
MERALRELRIAGVETSRELHVRVLQDPEFRRGDFDIQWLEKRLPSLIKPTALPAERRIAAIAAALLAERDRLEARATAGTSGPAAGDDRWRGVARQEALR